MLFKIIMYFIGKNEKLKHEIFHELLAGRPIIAHATIEGTGMTFESNVFYDVIIKNSELSAPLTVSGNRVIIIGNEVINTKVTAPFLTHKLTIQD